MAQLSVKPMTFADAMAQEFSNFRVGHNRWVECFSINGFLQGKLHGHSVFELTSEGDLTLDPCGYRTRTTAQAMRDFGRLFGIPLRVSFAGGGFTANIAGAEYNVGISGMISAKVQL